MNNKNDKFLGKLYDILIREELLNIIYDSKEVHLTNKVERVNKYLDKLKRVQAMMLEKDKLELLKKMYYDRYIIKPENVPEKYLRFLEKRYLDEGRGHVNLVSPQSYADKELRQQHIDTIINEQKSSLDSWLNYLLSPNSDYLEMWAKVWAFQGMLKIGNFDINKNTYGRRGNVTINPFVHFDSEILGRCVALVKQNLEGRPPTTTELDKLVESGNFAKIYGILLANKKKIKINGNEGIWIKYNYETEADALRKEQKGIIPEYLKLYNSLQGYNTGWCTAGSQYTAKEQICGSAIYAGGDFYVYYSKDENGEYKIPRIAIRMEKDNIGEIRGIADNQNLESEMEKILEDKLKEFPNADDYRKKTNHMKKLTEIYYKHLNGVELTKDELTFIYELKEYINGFGYYEDPRIEEIRKARSKRKDLAYVFDCKEEEIGLEGDKPNNSYVYCENILDIELTSAIDLKLPKHVMSSMYINKLESPEGLILPDYVHYHLTLSSLKSAEGLIFPRHIGMSLGLSNIEFINNTRLPEYVGEDLNLRKVKKVGKLELPKYVGGHLFLGNLTDFDELILPEHVGALFLDKITNIKGLKMPKIVASYLSLNGLTSAEGLELPEYIGGALNLDSLISAKGVKFPKRVEGRLRLNGLTTVEGLNLPEYVGSSLNLLSLKSAIGLVLPKHIGGLNLNGLKKHEGLNLPEYIAGFLNLNGLTNAEGLRFPERIDGNLYINNLTSLRNVILPKRVKGKIHYKGKEYLLYKLKQLQAQEEVDLTASITTHQR